MKLNSFKFQDGKVFWLPEYPEEPDYIQPGDTNSYAVMTDMNYTLQKEYNEAVAKSLASAIEVAPEDADKVKSEIWWNNIWTLEKDKKHGNKVGLDPLTKSWHPENGKVYSAECEMETFDLYNTSPHQVARLKPINEVKSEKAGRPEDFPWLAKEPEKSAGKWRVESSTSPIADTGDYFTQLWLTNGVVNLYSDKDDNETELQAIADQLNKDEIFPAANSHDMKDDDL